MEPDPALDRLLDLEKKAAENEAQAVKDQEEAYRRLRADLESQEKILRSQVEAEAEEQLHQDEVAWSRNREAELEKLQDELEGEPTDFAALGLRAWDLLTRRTP